MRCAATADEEGVWNVKSSMGPWSRPSVDLFKIHFCFFVVVVNDPMDDRMLGRTAHWLGWCLLRTHDAQEVQQRRQGWEEMGEEGNKSQSEVEEPESVWEKEKIW